VDGSHTFSAGPSSALAASPYGGACAYDPTRGAKGSIWYIGQNSGRLGRLDIATRTWSQSALFAVRSGEQCLTYIPDHDLLLMGAGASPWGVYDPRLDTYTNITVSGSPAGGNTSYGKCNPCYVAAEDAVMWWDAPGGATTLMNNLAIPPQAKTGTWVLTQKTPAAGNSVAPTPRVSNGTYGRGWYSPAMDAFFVFNEVAGHVYGFKRK